MVAVPLAPWLEDLPRDARGFIAPAEAGWLDGVPKLAFVATDRKLALAFGRGCAVCGFPMPKGAPVFRAFAQSDAAHMRQWERQLANDGGGPLHRSCILYSAITCPYLKERNSRLGKTSQINPGGRRGTRAAVMGFEDFGVMIYAHPHQLMSPTEPPPLFAYRTMVEDIGYRDGSELVDAYTAAVESDTDLIDMSSKRQYWTDDPVQVQEMVDILKAGFDDIRVREPDGDLIVDPTPYFIWDM